MVNYDYACFRALESINDLADIDPNPKRHKRRKKEVDVDYQLVETDELKSDHSKRISGVLTFFFFFLFFTCHSS